MVQKISSLTYGQSYRRFSELEQGIVKKNLNISKCHICTINEHMRVKFQTPLTRPNKLARFSWVQTAMKCLPLC